MKIRLTQILTIATALLLSHATFAGWGIKGIYVFGDSLSDSGNAALLDEGFFGEGEEFIFPTPPYYEGRASNGPVWIEIVADAYGYDVSPALDGGRNFAFVGAESGAGMSDQDTPNFLAQVELFKEALDSKEIKNIHPMDLFVIWVGINDFQRILDDEGEITGECRLDEGEKSLRGFCVAEAECGVEHRADGALLDVRVSAGFRGVGVFPECGVDTLQLRKGRAFIR